MEPLLLLGKLSLTLFLLKVCEMTQKIQWSICKFNNQLFFVWMKKMSAMRVAVIRMTSQKSNTNRTFHTLFVPLSLHLLLRMHMCLFGLHISILHVACSTQYLSSYFVCIWVLHLLSPLSVIVIIRIMIVIIINVFIVYMFDRNWCHPRTPSQQCFWIGLAVNVKIK